MHATVELNNSVKNRDKSSCRRAIHVNLRRSHRLRPLEAHLTTVGSCRPWALQAPRLVQAPPGSLDGTPGKAPPARPCLLRCPEHPNWKRGRPVPSCVLCKHVCISPSSPPVSLRVGRGPADPASRGRGQPGPEVLASGPTLRPLHSPLPRPGPRKGPEDPAQLCRFRRKRPGQQLREQPGPPHPLVTSSFFSSAVRLFSRATCCRAASAPRGSASPSRRTSPAASCSSRSFACIRLCHSRNSGEVPSPVHERSTLGDRGRRGLFGGS